MQALDSAVAAEPLHDLRITGKRARYLIEPFASELSAGETLIQRLKKLQDTLGKINDCAVLAGAIDEASDEITREKPDGPDLAALTALRGLVETERDAVFQRIEHGWKHRDMRPLLKRLRAAAEELKTQHAADG